MRRMLWTIFTLLIVLLVTSCVSTAARPLAPTASLGQARCAAADGLPEANWGTTACKGSQVWQCSWAGYSYAAHWQFKEDCGAGGCANGQCLTSSPVVLGTGPSAPAATLGQARCAAVDGLPEANWGTTACKGSQVWQCSWAGYSYAAHWQLKEDCGAGGCANGQCLTS